MLTHKYLAECARGAYSPHNSIRLALDLEFTPYANVIAIRGSELDPRDWVRNFMAFPWRCGPAGLAPFGFARATKRLYSYLQRKGFKYVDTDQPIYVTGHSAGGAMAILLADLLARDGWPVVECVAFAAPRTGRRLLRVPTTIYDHAGDPVCDVPPFWKHPVAPVVLPDMTDGPLQHSMDHYVAAMDMVER